MSLKSDDYDPTPAIERLTWALRNHLGGPLFRMAEPEIRDFLCFEVGGALRDAFSEAESIYLRDMCKQSDQASRNLLQGVLAGAEVSRRRSP